MARRIVLWVAVVALFGWLGLRVADIVRPSPAPAVGGAFGMRDGGNAVSVRVEEARIDHVDLWTTLTGTLEPEYEVDAVAERAGRLVSVHVDVGSRVEAGDVIAVVEHDELLVQRRQTEAQVGVSRAALQRVLLQLEQAIADEERTKQLHQRGAATQQEVDRARNQREELEIQRDSTQAQLAQAEANLELMDLQLERVRVKAPVSGVVMDRPVVVGTQVGVNTSVATIAAIDPIDVVFHLPERVISRVYVGQPFTLRVDAFPERTFAGEVRQLGAAFDPRTRTLPVRGAVANPELTLRPGMYAQIELLLDRRDNVLTVAREAILSGSDGPYVYVVQDDLATARTLTIGLEGSERVEVTGGLAEGEAVVVVGQHRLRDSRAVVVMPDELPPAVDVSMRFDDRGGSRP